MIQDDLRFSSTQPGCIFLQMTHGSPHGSPPFAAGYIGYMTCWRPASWFLREIQWRWWLDVWHGLTEQLNDGKKSLNT